MPLTLVSATPIPRGQPLQQLRCYACILARTTLNAKPSISISHVSTPILVACLLLVLISLVLILSYFQPKNLPQIHKLTAILYRCSYSGRLSVSQQANDNWS